MVFAQPGEISENNIVGRRGSSRNIVLSPRVKVKEGLSDRMSRANLKIQAESEYCKLALLQPGYKIAEPCSFQQPLF